MHKRRNGRNLAVSHDGTALEDISNIKQAQSGLFSWLIFSGQPIEYHVHSSDEYTSKHITFLHSAQFSVQVYNKSHLNSRSSQGVQHFKST